MNWLSKLHRVGVAASFFLLIFVLPAFSDTSSQNPSGDVTLYLRSGEVIKGGLEQKTEDDVVIKKADSTFSFKLADILKIKDSSGAITVPRKLPFKTAIITYDWQGHLVGKQVVYIDIPNNKIATEVSVKSGTGSELWTMEQDSRQIYDGLTMYGLNMKDKTFLKAKKEGDIISTIFGEDFYAGSPVRNDTLLGKECLVYESKSIGTAAFWNGIMLKQVNVNDLGKDYIITKVAVDIQQDVPLPVDKFEIPSEFVIEDSKEETKGVAGKSSNESSSKK